MKMIPLLAASFIMKVVAVLFVICCVALILIILVQKGRGGGLSGAFGGGMASGILDSKTGDFLTWVTIVLVGVFLTLAVVMAKFYKEKPTGKFDAPVRQEQPAEPGQTPPVGDTRTPTSATTDNTEVNSPGG